jgi:hypothetical protein
MPRVRGCHPRWGDGSMPRAIAPPGRRRRPVAAPRDRGSHIWHDLSPAIGAGGGGGGGGGAWGRAAADGAAERPGISAHPIVPRPRRAAPRPPLWICTISVHQSGGNTRPTGPPPQRGEQVGAPPGPKGGPNTGGPPGPAPRAGPPGRGRPGPAARRVQLDPTCGRAPNARGCAALQRRRPRAQPPRDSNAAAAAWPRAVVAREHWLMRGRASRGAPFPGAMQLQPSACAPPGSISLLAQCGITQITAGTPQIWQPRARVRGGARPGRGAARGAAGGGPRRATPPAGLTPRSSATAGC